MKIHKSAFKLLPIILFLVISLNPGNLFTMDSSDKDVAETKQLEQKYINPHFFPAQIRPGIKGGAHLTRLTVDLLLPLSQTEEYLFFLNPRIMLTDSDANEANYGLGFRKLIYNNSWILGANLYYDRRKSQYHNYFDQIGFGLEALSQKLDFRINYYYPLSDAKRITDLDVGSFTESTLIRYNGFEEPLQGIDYEAGFLVPYISKVLETRFYVGGFYYNAEKSKDMNGERLRLEARPNSFFTFEAEWKKVNGGKSNTFYGGYISLPFDLGAIFQHKNPFSGWKDTLKLGKGARPLKERMTDMVIRDLDITTQSKTDYQHPEKLADVIFVDNSNSGTQDGTNSHPYTSLSQVTSDSDYVDDTWVFVRKGTSTYTSTNFTLKGNVTLWGDGYAYLGLGGAGAPVLDGNGSGSVVTLATGNTVQGLTFQNGAYGIQGTNPSTVLIRNNTVNSNSSDGINITTSGSGSHTITIKNNTATDNIGNNILVYTTGTSNSDVTISNNTVTDNITSALFEIGVWANDSSVISATISNNTINGTKTNGGMGIGLVADSDPGNASTLTATVSGNYINNGGDHNDNNAIIANTMNSGGTGATTITCTITNNTVTGGDGGITLYANVSGSSITGTVSGNTVTNFLTGINAQAMKAGSTVTMLAEQNTVTDSSDGAFYFCEPGTVVADLGGGSLGSVGKNRIFNNGVDFSVDFSSDTTISAKYNWLGSATATPTLGPLTLEQQILYTPQLTSDPNL